MKNLRLYESFLNEARIHDSNIGKWCHFTDDTHKVPYLIVGAEEDGAGRASVYKMVIDEKVGHYNISKGTDSEIYYVDFAKVDEVTLFPEEEQKNFGK